MRKTPESLFGSSRTCGRVAVENLGEILGGEKKSFPTLSEFNHSTKKHNENKKQTSFKKCQRNRT